MPGPVSGPHAGPRSYALSRLGLLARHAQSGSLNWFFHEYLKLREDPGFLDALGWRVHQHLSGFYAESFGDAIRRFREDAIVRQVLAPTPAEAEDLYGILAALKPDPGAGSAGSHPARDGIRKLLEYAHGAGRDGWSAPVDEIRDLAVRIRSGFPELAGPLQDLADDLETETSFASQDLTAAAIVLLDGLADAHVRGMRVGEEGLRTLRSIRTQLRVLGIEGSLVAPLPRLFMSGQGPTAREDCRIVAAAWGLVEEAVASSLPPESPFFDRATGVNHEFGPERTSAYSSAISTCAEGSGAAAEARAPLESEDPRMPGLFAEVRAALAERDRWRFITLLGQLMNHPDCAPVVRSVREEVENACRMFREAIGSSPDGKDPEGFAFRIGAHSLQLVRDLWEFIIRGSVAPQGEFSLLAPDSQRYAVAFLNSLVQGTEFGRVAPLLLTMLPPFELEDGSQTEATLHYLELFSWLLWSAEREIRSRVPYQSDLLRFPAKPPFGRETPAEMVDASAVEGIHQVVDDRLPAVEAGDAVMEIREDTEQDWELSGQSDPPAKQEDRAATDCEDAEQAPPKWADRSTYVGRTYLALEECYRECPDDFVPVARIEEMTGDRSAKQGVQALKEYPELRVLIEGVRDARRAGKPVPEDAQGYRLTGLPKSRKSR